MSLNTSYTLINHSFFGESRVLFEPFTKETDFNTRTQKVGVRTHCWLTALILSLFGKIETVKIATGETLYLNKGSVANWLERHGEHSQDALVERISRICKQALPVLSEKMDSPKETPPTPAPPEKHKIVAPVLPFVEEVEEEVEIEEERDVKVEADKAKLEKLINDIKIPDFSPVVDKPIKAPSFEESDQQTLKKYELAKKIGLRWKAYAKRAEKRAQLHERYLKSAQERIKERKIFEYAKTHVPRAEAWIYTPEGHLRNIVEEEKSRNRLSEFKNDIEKSKQEVAKLRKKLEKLEEGPAKEKILADIRDYEEEIAKWPKKEEKWLKSIAEGMQKTLFPIKCDSREISLAQMIEECAENEWYEKHVYHGTSMSRAHYARENGLEKSFPSKRTLDAGSATYFALEPQSAFGYAKKKEEGVLTCSVKLKKVAKIKDYGGLWMLVEEYFLPLTRRYMNDNKTEILQALSVQGAHILGKEFSDFEDGEIFRRHLTHELTKLFFQKMGFDGIHVHYSSRAGCGYLAVFEPGEENLQVLSLEKTKECLKEERDRLEGKKEKLLANAQA